MQGLEALPAIFTDDDLDMIAFPQAGLTQAISGEPHGQAVAPAADRLLEVPACIRGYALRPGRSHGAKSGIHTTLRLVGCSLLCLESDGPPPKPSHRPSHIQA